MGLCQPQALAPLGCDQDLEAARVDDLGQLRREDRIVFDDQQVRLVGLQRLAIIVDARQRPAGARRRHRWQWRERLRGASRPRPLLGQVERERAALAGRAFELQLTAQQQRQLARDRQPQPRSAVAAIGARVDLLERREHPLLLLLRDPDPGVADHQRHRPLVDQIRPSETRPCRRSAHAQRDAAVPGELDRVAEQVGQDLIHALPIGLDVLRQRRRDLDDQLQPLVVRQRREHAARTFEELRQRHSAR